MFVVLLPCLGFLLIDLVHVIELALAKSNPQIGIFNGLKGGDKRGFLTDFNGGELPRETQLQCHLKMLWHL